MVESGGMGPHDPMDMAGELVLVPLTITLDDPRAPCEVTWWVNEWLAAKRVRVWRAPVDPLRASDSPDRLITPLFRLTAFRVASTVLPCDVPLDRVEFTGAAVAPGGSLMLRIASQLDEPTEIVVAVSVERPPSCFRARAAA